MAKHLKPTVSYVIKVHSTSPVTLADEAKITEAGSKSSCAHSNSKIAGTISIKDEASAKPFVHTFGNTQASWSRSPRNCHPKARIKTFRTQLFKCVPFKESTNRNIDSGTYTNPQQNGLFSTRRIIKDQNEATVPHRPNRRSIPISSAQPCPRFERRNIRTNSHVPVNRISPPLRIINEARNNMRQKKSRLTAGQSSPPSNQENNKGRNRRQYSDDDSGGNPQNESLPFGYLAVEHYDGSMFQDDESADSSADCSMYELPNRRRRKPNTPPTRGTDPDPLDRRRKGPNNLENIETKENLPDKAISPQETELTNEEYIERLKTYLKSQRSPSDRSFLSDTEGYSSSVKEELKQMKEHSHTWSLDSYMDAFPDFEYPIDTAAGERRIEDTKRGTDLNINDRFGSSEVTKGPSDLEQHQLLQSHQTLEQRQASERRHALELCQALEERQDLERRLVQQQLKSSTSSRNSVIEREVYQSDKKRDSMPLSSRNTTGKGSSSKRNSIGSEAKPLHDEDYDADYEDLSSTVATIPKATSKHQAVLSEILEQLHETQEVLDEFEQSLKSKSAVASADGQKEIDMRQIVALIGNRDPKGNSVQGKIRVAHASYLKPEQIDHDRPPHLIPQGTTEPSLRRVSDSSKNSSQKPAVQESAQSRKLQRSMQQSISKTKDNLSATHVPSKQDELVDTWSQKLSRNTSASPQSKIAGTTSKTSKDEKVERRMASRKQSDTPFSPHSVNTNLGNEIIVSDKETIFHKIRRMYAPSPKTSQKKEDRPPSTTYIIRTIKEGILQPILTSWPSSRPGTERLTIDDYESIPQPLTHQKIRGKSRRHDDEISSFDHSTLPQEATEFSSTRATKGSTSRQTFSMSREESQSREISAIEGRAISTSAYTDTPQYTSQASSTKATRGSTGQPISTLNETVIPRETEESGKRAVSAATSTRYSHEASKTSSTRATKGSTSRRMSLSFTEDSAIHERSKNRGQTFHEPEWKEMEMIMPNIPAHCKVLLEHERRNQGEIHLLDVQGYENSRQNSRSPLKPVQGPRIFSELRLTSQPYPAEETESNPQLQAASISHTRMEMEKVSKLSPIPEFQAAGGPQSTKRPHPTPKFEPPSESRARSQLKPALRSSRITRTGISSSPEPGAAVTRTEPDKSKIRRKLFQVQRCKEACEKYSFSSADTGSYEETSKKTVQRPGKEDQTPARHLFSEIRSSSKKRRGRASSGASPHNLDGNFDMESSSHSESEIRRRTPESSSVGEKNQSTSTNVSTKKMPKNRGSKNSVSIRQKQRSTFKQNETGSRSRFSQPQSQSLRSHIELGCDVEIGSDEEASGSNTLPSETLSKGQEVSCPRLSSPQKCTTSSSEHIQQNGQSSHMTEESKIYHQGRPISIGTLNQSHSSGAILCNEQNTRNTQPCSNHSSLCQNYIRIGEIDADVQSQSAAGGVSWNVTSPQMCQNFNRSRNTVSRSQPWPTYERPTRNAYLSLTCSNFNTPRHERGGSRPWPTYERPTHNVSLPIACPKVNVPRHNSSSQIWPKYERPVRTISLPKPCPNFNVPRHKYDGSQPWPKYERPVQPVSLPRPSPNSNVTRQRYGGSQPWTTRHVSTPNVTKIVRKNPSFQSAPKYYVPAEVNNQSHSSNDSVKTVENVPSQPSRERPVKDDSPLLSTKKVPEPRFHPLPIYDIPGQRSMTSDSFKTMHIAVNGSHFEPLPVDNIPERDYSHRQSCPNIPEHVMKNDDEYQNALFDSHGYLLHRPATDESKRYFQEHDVKDDRHQFQPSQDVLVDADGYILPKPVPQDGLVDAYAYLLPRSGSQEEPVNKYMCPLPLPESDTGPFDAEGYILPGAVTQGGRATDYEYVLPDPVSQNEPADTDGYIFLQPVPPKHPADEPADMDHLHGHLSHRLNSSAMDRHTHQKRFTPLESSFQEHTYESISEHSYAAIPNSPLEEIHSGGFAPTIGPRPTEFYNPSDPNESPPAKFIKEEWASTSSSSRNSIPHKMMSTISLSSTSSYGSISNSKDYVTIDDTPPNAAKSHSLSKKIAVEDAKNRSVKSHSPPGKLAVVGVVESLLDLDTSRGINSSSEPKRRPQSVPKDYAIEVIDIDLTPNEEPRIHVVEGTQDPDLAESTTKMSTTKEKTRYNSRSPLSGPTVSITDAPLKTDYSYYVIEEKPVQKATKLEECSRMCLANKVQVSDRNRLLKDLDEDPHFLALTYHLVGSKTLKKPASKLTKQDKEQLVDKLIVEFSEAQGSFVNPLLQLQEELSQDKVNQDKV